MCVCVCVYAILNILFALNNNKKEVILPYMYHTMYMQTVMSYCDIKYILFELAICKKLCYNSAK